MKLSTSFLGSNIINYEKLMLNSERAFKIKVRSRWTILEISLSSAVIAI